MHAWNFTMQLDPYTWKLIRYQPWSGVITGKGWHELWKWWSARHCNTTSSGVHQHKPITHWASIQQYRKWGPGNTIWAREVPPLLFCQEVCIITGHNLLVAILRKDVDMVTVQKQPHKRQRPGNHWHEYECVQQ